MMLCDKCRKNEANVHVTQYVNGVKYEQNLCGECAGIANAGLFSGFGGFGMGDIESMFHDLHEMSLIGRRDDSMLVGVQPPAYSDCSEFEAMGLKLSSVEEQRPDQEKKVSEKESLKAEMEQAVCAEDYERAAELRDEIYFMEKEEVKRRKGIDKV